MRDINDLKEEFIDAIFHSTEIKSDIDGYLFLENMITEYIGVISGKYDKMGKKEEIPAFREFLDAVAERRAKEWYY